uniref:protein-serine/threonine phosphatase n=1 Tax=Phaeomonas parva TaxID=124430 RepID=A0A6U4GZ25_9STRA|eukprot:CAMPEP_0118851902 /NCGR_PEP_ID=MMETSP1163-20130328/1156_1 /TAXON_ID=124430 /ORGANISM="Phaeomonas parva, Strain CCMP2877" /LENGTH=1019 /DNA_ID=CAMNT_0006784295 /DNA_START=16 /DNA_END=3075 /DNA_ORIENTATION=+
MGCLQSKDEANPQGGSAVGLTQSRKAQKQNGPLSRDEINARLTTCESTESFRIGNCNIRFAFRSQRGYYPDQPDKENQDAFIAIPHFMGDDNLALFGVFDGHGREGHLCARFVAEKVPYNLTKFLSRKMGFAKALHETMKLTNQELHSDDGIDDQLSGTTAIVMLIHGNLCYVANVGDSRAIVAQTTGEDDQNGRVIAKALSSDQTPYRRDECQRVKACGARVMSMDQIEGHVPMHENWGDINLGEDLDEGGDPPRVWSPFGDYPGTAFTRSLGDSLAEELGVFAEPEILTREIHPHDKFMVIASDGIFEFLTNQSVADMVRDIPDPLAACEACVEESYNLWLRYEVRTDDITMISLYMEMDEGFQPTRASVRLDEVQIGGVRPVRRVMSREKKKVISTTDEDEDAQEGDGDDEDVLDMEALAVPKTDEERARIRDAVHQNFLFKHLTDEQLEQVINVMAKVPVVQGAVVIRQNERGDKFYIADEGIYEVRVTSSPAEALAAQGTPVHTYVATETSHPGFGELALMYSHPRAASVVAKTEGLLWALNRKVFRHVVLRRNRKALIKTLSNVEVLQSLTLQQLQRLCDIMQENTFTSGTKIVKQGEVGNEMYIVSSGTAVCQIKDSFGRRKDVLELKDNMYFGERALLTEEPRAADVVATSDIRVLTISKELFEEVLGPLQNIIDADRERRERRAVQRDSKPPLQEMALSGSVTYEGGATDIGEWVSGATPDGEPVTLRILNKASVEAHGQAKALECSALVSRELQDEADVGADQVEAIRKEGGVCLPAFTYKDENRVYMLYKREIAASIHDVLDGDIAPPAGHVLYIAQCIARALVALHNADAIYRSFSLDHVFIDATGHVCLADYGFSKWLAGAEQAFTICGTAEYLAPEQVKQAGYDDSVDWWALGCFVYEILHGRSPFVGGSELAIYSNITSHVKGAVRIDPSVSTELKALIQGLLDPNPVDRAAFAKENLLRGSVPETSPFLEWAAEKYRGLREQRYDDELSVFPYTGEGNWFSEF